MHPLAIIKYPLYIDEKLGTQKTRRDRPPTGGLPIGCYALWWVRTGNRFPAGQSGVVWPQRPGG